MRIIYLFIDGIGYGPPDPDTNPFHRYAESFLAPLGGKSPQTGSVPESWNHVPTDAHMGLTGLPQSATGQTSLWTGVNGPQTMGHHKTGFPGPTLIRVIQEYSIIKQVVEAGKKASLLNAYSEKYHERIRRHPRLTSASTHVQMASGQDLKSWDDLREGQAMFMDITHKIMHEFFGEEAADEFPIMDATERGRDLARMARAYDLVVFEYFLTDKAGHNQSFEQACMCIETLEAFLGGLTAEMNPAEELLVITSDHGNLEDLSRKTHTNNQVPTFAYGYRADDVLSRAARLMDIPPALYDVLELDVSLPDDTAYSQGK